MAISEADFRKAVRKAKAEQEAKAQRQAATVGVLREAIAQRENDRRALDAAFGTTPSSALIEKRGCVQTFRPMTPEQAREHLSRRERGGR